MVSLQEMAVLNNMTDWAPDRRKPAAATVQEVSLTAKAVKTCIFCL